MFNTLSYIGQIFNDSNIVWGVGASILLNQFGLADSPNDIDIHVHIKDIHKVDEILKSIGTKKKQEKTDSYSTKYFYEYIVNGIDIDVMARLAINHINGVFEYIFDENSISQFISIDKISIPFTSLEDWFVLYQLIPNRDAKVKIIEDYLLLNGIKKLFLLERSLVGNLPLTIIERIYNLKLNSSKKEH
ncbi:hypothetical protein [uncultured Clostridium sp.]|uniref:hypothetical protein n=1 Tax=uncultured Clostridium sp. TaxID=59620 RepID=UPI00261941B9|nr:hypothetical protein [uncultured Clostridium sp.]